MPYVIGWIIYLSMAALLMFGFERYLARFLTQRQWRIFIRALLAILLFTPGFVSADGIYVVPACVGVMFNILAHSGEGLFKASLPLLLAGALVYGVLFLVEVLDKEGRTA